MNIITLSLFIIISVFFIWKLFSNPEIVRVKSKIDNNIYIIRNGNKSQKYLEESADTLAIINQKILKLIEHLKKKYDINNSKYLFIYKLVKNYNSGLLSEAANDKRFTTFTIDKQDMHICLRTRDGEDKLYNIDVLMYVILHELAHLCNYDMYGVPIIGHGKEFKYIFRLLVTEAIDIGIYKYINFTQTPTEYCGIVINSTII